MTFSTRWLRYAWANTLRNRRRSGVTVGIAALGTADPSPLAADQETALLSALMEYPVVIENAARELAPHLIAFYLRGIAADFHSYYNSTRLLVPDDSLRLARLALAVAVRQVLRNGLAVLGVSAPEKM